jgi:hypothetical protein
MRKFDGLILTYEKTSEVLGVETSNKLRDYFIKVSKSNYSFEDANLTVEEQLENLHKMIPKGKDYIIAFKTEIIDKLDNISNITEINRSIQKFEIRLLSDKDIPATDKDNLLIFVSVFKYSLNQIISEFSSPKHPFHELYFPKTKVSGKAVGVAVADGCGAVKWELSMVGTGPVGVAIGAVGGGAISSLAAATTATLWDVVGSWF